MRGFHSSSTTSSGSLSVRSRLLSLASSLDTELAEERGRYESTIASLQDRLSSAKTSLQLEKARSKRQQELIDALQDQLRDSQLVEQLQNKDTSIQQAKLVQQLENLQAEVMALRFQLLDQQVSGKSYSQRLVEAAGSASLEEVKDLLSPGRDGVERALEQYRRTLSRALCQAARNRNGAEIVTLLLTCGANPFEAYQQSNPNDQEQQEGSATDDGMDEDKDVHQAWMDTESEKGWNALHYAAKAGHDKILEKLLSFGTHSLGNHLEDKTWRDNLTPLHLAARARQPKCVKILLRHGADITALDSRGRSAIDLVVTSPPSSPSSSPTASSSVSSTSPPKRGKDENAENEEKGNTTAVEAQTDLEDKQSDGDLDMLKRNIPKAEHEEEKKARARETLESLNDPTTLFWSHSVRANRLYGAEDYAGAKRAYDEAISLTERLPQERITSDTNKATLYYNSARAYVKLGCHSEAIRRCTTAINLRQGSYPNALAQRAASFMTLLDYSKAVQDYKVLINLEKRNNADARTGAGDLAAGDISGSSTYIEYLERAEKLAAKASDHYLVLGIEADATSVQIKQAFRKQCLRWHPDKHRGSEDDIARASIMFKAINEANEVLSDEQKRTLYDIDRISKRMDDIVKRQNEEQQAWQNGNASANNNSNRSNKKYRPSYSSTTQQNTPSAPSSSSYFSSASNDNSKDNPTSSNTEESNKNNKYSSFFNSRAYEKYQTRKKSPADFEQPPHFSGYASKWFNTRRANRGFGPGSKPRDEDVESEIVSTTDEDEDEFDIEGDDFGVDDDLDDDVDSQDEEEEEEEIYAQDPRGYVPRRANYTQEFDSFFFETRSAAERKQ